MSGLATPIPHIPRPSKGDEAIQALMLVASGHTDIAERVMPGAVARNQMLFDIFVTAIEGGVNYWARCHTYRWVDTAAGPDANGYHREDLRNFHAIIIEDELGDELRVDRTVIDNGYTIASAMPEVYRWSTGNPPLVVTADTDWDFDAGDADAIVQLGLFGKIIYG